MVELLPPDIKATDSRSMDRSGDTLASLDSPSTGDGSQSARPKSSSSEGMLCLASSKLSMHLIMYSRHAVDVLEAVVHGSCIYIYLGVFLLTVVSLADNGQKSAKKSPVRLSRGPPSKIGNLPKASTSPPPERPSTAIDPLSHVRFVCPPPPRTELRQIPQESEIYITYRRMLIAL
jgi:hypothetical protein